MTGTSTPLQKLPSLKTPASSIGPTLATGDIPFARRMTRTIDWCQTVARRTLGILYHAKKDDLSAPGDAV